MRDSPMNEMLRWCERRAAKRAVGVVMLGITAFGCDPIEVGKTSEAVVYDADDRVEVYELSTGALRSVAGDAIAMQVDVGWIDQRDPSDVRLTYRQTLADDYGLCADVAFADQVDPGSCSGTLIDDRHVLTAGHCVEGADACDGATGAWVLGYHYAGPGRLRTLTADDVHFCQRVVVSRNDFAEDYAVIELDRPVVGHLPADVRRTPVFARTPVTLIGHPNGIAAKVAGGARIVRAEGVELYADVDAFFGNSGSGVFDDAGELVGVLVAGAPEDYARRPGAACNEVIVTDVASGDAEVLTDVATPLAAFCAAPGIVSRACGGPSVDDAGLDGGSTVGSDGGIVEAPERSGGCAVVARAGGLGGGSRAALVLVGVCAVVGLSRGRRVARFR